MLMSPAARPRSRAFSRMATNFAIAAASATASLHAAAPTLEADEQSFDQATQSMRATGNAIFRHDEIEVISEEVRFFRQEQKTEVEDNVRVTTDEFRMVTNRVDYLIEDKALDSTAFRLGNATVMIAGEHVSGTREELQFENATIYFGEPDPLTPRLKAAHGTLFTGDRLEAQDITVKVGDLTLFKLNKQTVYAKQVPFDVQVRGGYRDNLGAYLQTESLYPVSQNLSVGANLDGYTARGFLVGPRFLYETQEGPLDTRSDVSFGWIEDLGDDDQLGTDILNRPIEETRHFMELRHQQAFAERLSLQSSISWWSDSEVTRDFREDDFEDNQLPDNFAELVYRGNDFFVSAFLRYDPNGFQVYQERLPEIRFEWMPTEIGDTGIYQTGFANYVYLREQNPAALDDIDVHRWDAYYAWQKPIPLNGWLNVAPVIGTRLNYWSDGTGAGTDSHGRIVGELGFDADMTLHAEWDYTNAFWGIDGLRHIMRPVARYRYYPGAQYGQGNVFPIDDDPFLTSMLPLELASVRSIDTLTDTNVFRLGVENQLQTRAADGYGSRDLVRWDIYQDIDFNGEPGPESDTFTSTYSFLEVEPAHWLSLDMSNRFDTEELRHVEQRLRLTLRDGNVQRLSLAAIGLRDEIEQYRIRWRRDFSSRWGVDFEWRYDGQIDKLTEQRYRLRQRISNSWDVTYEFAVREDARREDDFSFRVRFSFLKF